MGPALVGVALALLAGAGIWTQLDRFRAQPSADTATAAAPDSLPAPELAAQPTTSGEARGRPTLGQPELNYVGEIKWTSTWVNVRQERGGNAPVVRTLNPGEQVRVDSLAAGWWRVYVDGQFQGYVANRLLLDEPPF